MVGIGNFHNSFFVKNYYLNLNFFQVLQSALLKTPPQKKKILKKDVSHLKLLDMTRDRKKTSKNKKEKRKMRKSQK